MKTVDKNLKILFCGRVASQDTIRPRGRKALWKTIRPRVRIALWETIRPRGRIAFPIEKYTENTELKVLYKINGTF